MRGEVNSMGHGGEHAKRRRENAEGRRGRRVAEKRKGEREGGKNKPFAQPLHSGRGVRSCAMCAVRIGERNAARNPPPTPSLGEGGSELRELDGF